MKAVYQCEVAEDEIMEVDCGSPRRIEFNVTKGDRLAASAALGRRQVPFLIAQLQAWMDEGPGRAADVEG